MLKIYNEITLNDFAGWSGARDTLNELTEREKDLLTNVLSDIYPEGLSETQLNDILWFEDNFIEDVIARKLFE